MLYLLTEVKLIIRDLFDLGKERSRKDAVIFYKCHVVIIIAICAIIYLAAAWSEDAARAGSFLRFLLAIIYPLAMTVILIGKKELRKDEAARALIWTVACSFFLYVFGGMIVAARLTTRPTKKNRLRQTG